METVIIILLVAILMALSAPFAMIGMGGGTAYVPVLEIANVNIHEASTISLFMIMISTLSAAIVFHSKKEIDWHMLSFIVPAVAIGAFFGGYISHIIIAPIITVVFAVFLCASAFLIYRHDHTKEGEMHKIVPKLFVWNRKYGEYHYSVSLGVLIPTVLGLGFISGMLGVGGGLFLLPIFILIFRVPMRITIGITTIYAGASAVMGLFGHLAGGDLLNLWIAIPLAIAVFIGARIGSQMSHKTNIPKLKTTIAVLLIVLAVLMLFKAL